MSVSVSPIASAEMTFAARPGSYRPSKPQRDRNFRKNWQEFSYFSTNPVHRQRKIVSSLLSTFLNYKEEDSLSSVYLHHLRLRAIIVGLFGLNNHKFTWFLDQDVVVPPIFSAEEKSCASYYMSAFELFLSGGDGASSFDHADQVFGRIRHARWLAAWNACMS